MEKHFFFKNRNRENLFGVFHIPQENCQDQVFIFCAPTFGEKTKTYRMLINFARLLEKSGYYAFRFDYFGEGDSAGNFEDADIESRLTDISDAIEFCVENFKGVKINLIGLRLGATLSILAANRTKNINSLILWAPIFDIRLYLFEFLRGNLSNQLLVNRKIILNREQLVGKIVSGELVNVDGWLICKRFWEQGKEINLKTEIENLKQECICINLIDTQSKAYASTEEHANLNHKVKIYNLEPEFTFSDWKSFQPYPKNLFTRTLEWVKEQAN